MKKDFLIIGAIALVAVIAAQMWRGQSTQSVVAEMDTQNQDTLRYADYTPTLFAQLNTQRRVLFFKANWCDTCAQADTEISAQTSLLPADVTVLKVNYDQEIELRTKYGVTAQHTFVEVDSNGELVQIWNGGSVEQLLEELG